MLDTREENDYNSEFSQVVLDTVTFEFAPTTPRLTKYRRIAIFIFIVYL